MLKITSTLFLDEGEISYNYIRSTGPGGQNVNKVATAVQLRFDVTNTTSLPQEIKERLTKLAGNRLTRAGILVIEAKRYRTQEHNRQDAEQRLVALLQKASARPKKRHPTHPTAASIAKRIEAKKRRSTIKQFRKSSADQAE